ncbi:MAG: hypothetical protein SGI92_02420 [Bryobacteraceae bacterium]|nr:hypothetical protein [Bryobacteraceae bacterium]
MMITRRTWIAGVAGAAHLRGSGPDAAIERAHEEMWARFIDKEYGTVYDYAPFQGKVDLPTAEDCQDLKPNGMAWWTPVENGGFFGGLYLSALCGRWKEQKSARRADEAHTVATGLVRLAPLYPG